MTAQVPADRHFALSVAKKASAALTLVSDLVERSERSAYAKAPADNLRPDALLTGKRGRKGGLEPPRYCYRQPLKLVRLPIPPLPRGGGRPKGRPYEILPASDGPVLVPGVAGAGVRRRWAAGVVAPGVRRGRPGRASADHRSRDPR